MELRHLRCFVVVAEELHFGRAARSLHVAQPAVSQTIAALERELGLLLFERTSREVSLTAGGKALLPHAQSVLERADTFGDTARQVRLGTAGRVAIGVSPALPPHVLTDVLAIAREATSGVHTVAKSLTRADPATALADGDLDLVLIRGPVQMPGVLSVMVASEPVGVALPADHPLADARDVAAASLNDQPLVAFPRREDPAQFDRIFGALNAAGLTSPGELHESPIGAVEASLRLVAAAEALSLKLESEVNAFGQPTVVWRPLRDVQLSVDVHLVWRIDLANPAARNVATATASNLARTLSAHPDQ